MIKVSENKIEDFQEVIFYKREKEKKVRKLKCFYD